jgi:hypothetical protein
MIFQDYNTAKVYAETHNLPIWDTHQLPDRYYVGELTNEIEEYEDGLTLID